ncbi:MAG TPA: sensor histidine kinase [Puia sp.]|uniref:sensor histidine kinase n=1 Tax=Puia sp. TaxID=2045100 RepID=UPI002CCE26F9|nr:sensor histidine kinase [Puia sp.]HVU94973.1 sensor histidine kinase [Puia sp.]
MTGRIHPLLLHLAGCVLFLSLPILLSPESLTLRAYLTNPPTQRDLIIYILVLAIFYANYFFLIPKYYFPRKYAPFIFLNTLCFSLLILIPLVLIPHPTPRYLRFIPPPQNTSPGPSNPPNPTTFTNPPPNPPGSLQPYRFRDLSQHLFLFLVVLFLALLLKIRDRLRRAEEEKLHAELAYLKAQINPHFLFNILNSIYALALERSERTAGAVVKLSSMMRYVLLEAGRDRVPLEQELAYLTGYTLLQQTRFEDALDLDFSVTGRPDGKTIAPLLLIPFVENAFKHGVNPEQPSAILIRIDIGASEIRLHVANKKVVAKTLPSAPAGLGIDNTRQRLGILYPGRHTLSITDGADDFDVLLTLRLT